MGRGRQKAKHTKVARELKYFSPQTNYDALERELTGHTGDPYDEEIAKWEEYVEKTPLDNASVDDSSSMDRASLSTEDEPHRA